MVDRIDVREQLRCSHKAGICFRVLPMSRRRSVTNCFRDGPPSDGGSASSIGRESCGGACMLGAPSTDHIRSSYVQNNRHTLPQPQTYAESGTAGDNLNSPPPRARPRPNEKAKGHQQGSIFSIPSRSEAKEKFDRLVNKNKELFAKAVIADRRSCSPCGPAHEPGATNTADPGNTGGQRAKGGQRRPKKKILSPPDSRLKLRIHPQTGPTSEEGKRAVSHNALKHGFYAHPTEADREFAACEQAVLGSLGPSGEIQTRIARSVAVELWRIGKIEDTVILLERGIDEERVNLSHLADQLEFPFGKSYSPLLLLYMNEADLRRRVLGHCSGVFAQLHEGLLANESLKALKAAARAQGPMAHQANERLGSLLELARLVLAEQSLVQHMHEEFFQEFDAVMLDTRLGRNNVGAALLDAGELMPLVECWVYRNHMQIRVVVRRMQASLRLDLLVNPKIERALNTARSRLNSLLRDYVLEAPDKLSQARTLGFFDVRRGR